MRRWRFLGVGVVLTLLVSGTAFAALVDLGNGVIYDDTAMQYWIQDLTLFAGQNRAAQLTTIAALNANPAYLSSVWGPWHLADSTEAWSLFPSWYQFPTFFIPSDSIPYPGNPYPTREYWWGRYDAQIDLSGTTYDKVMHTARLQGVPGSGDPDILYGGMENYILPGESTAYGTAVGAWVTADYLPPTQSVPEPSTLLLLGSALAGLGGMAWRRKQY